MGELVFPPIVTTLATNPDLVLEKSKGKLKHVVVVGLCEDGTEYFAASDADGGSALWLLERAKTKLLAVPDTFDQR